MLNILLPKYQMIKKIHAYLKQIYLYSSFVKKLKNNKKNQLSKKYKNLLKMKKLKNNLNPRRYLIKQNLEFLVIQRMKIRNSILIIQLFNILIASQ